MRLRARALSAPLRTFTDSHLALRALGATSPEFPAVPQFMCPARPHRTRCSSGIGFIIDAAAYNYSSNICDLHPEQCSPFDGITGLLELDAAGTPILMGPGPGMNLLGEGDITAEWLAGGGASLLAHNSSSYSLRDELNGPTFNWLLQANAMYLAPAFQIFGDVYLRTGLAAIDDYVLFLNFLVPCFLTLFILAMVFVFMPHIKQTNEDIQKKRTMVSRASARAGKHGAADHKLAPERTSARALGGSCAAELPTPPLTATHVDPLTISTHPIPPLARFHSPFYSPHASVRPLARLAARPLGRPPAAALPARPGYPRRAAHPAPR